MKLLAIALIVGLGQSPADSPSRAAAVGNPGVASFEVDSSHVALKRLSDSLQMVLMRDGNDQLSRQSDMLGNFVGALGVLFTVLAIATAFVLFRQSSDYRALVDEEIKKYQRILDAFIADKNAQVEALKVDVAAQIDSVRTGHAKATGEEREKLAAQLARLEKLERSFVARPAPTSLSSGSFSAAPLPLSGLAFGTPMVLSGSLGYQRICDACGKAFAAPLAAGLLGDASTIKCSHCGTEQSRDH